MRRIPPIKFPESNTEKDNSLRIKNDFIITCMINFDMTLKESIKQYYTELKFAMTYKNKTAREKLTNLINHLNSFIYYKNNGITLQDALRFGLVKTEIKKFGL